MLNDEDKALWEAYTKTVQPLSKVSKFKIIGQKFSFHFGFKRKEKAFVPEILDLHGFTLEEAYSLFLRFLNYHIQQKTKKIIVITGKGKDGKGLLKAEFPKWVENFQIKDKIKSVTQPLSYGGGAFELTLKSKEK